MSQTYHYKYEYTIKSDGQKIYDNLDFYAGEYSITYSGNDFFFSNPNGQSLSRSFMFDVNVNSLYILFNSDNIAHYSSKSISKWINESIKSYNVHCVSDAYDVIVGGRVSMKGIGPFERAIEVSLDGKTLVILEKTAAYVYKRINNRTIFTHTAHSKRSTGGYNSNGYNNSAEICSLCGGSGKCSGAGNIAYSNMYCNGSGRCTKCYGNGYYSNPFGTGYVDCAMCNKTGKCGQCSGTGRCNRCNGTGRR